MQDAQSHSTLFRAESQTPNLPDIGASEANRPILKASTLAQRVRFLLLILGTFVLVWPFFDSRFKDAEHNLTGLSCLPVAVGVGLLVMAIAIGGTWQRSAAWFILALNGQAVSLQIAKAGWQLRYQHYKSLDELMTDGMGTMFLLFLVAQGLLVMIGLRSYIAPIVCWCKVNLRPWQLMFVGLFFVLPTTTVSPSVAAYLREWAFAVALQSVALATILLAAAAVPSDALTGLHRRILVFFGGLVREDHINDGRPDRFALTLAAAVTIVAAFLCIYSYERHPHVPDEVAYLMQARFFAAGSLTLPAPPVPGGFETYLMSTVGDNWFAVPPPGWPLILAIGTLVGLPWLVNPMLAGINVLLAYVLLRDLYPKLVARSSVFLLVLSPWYLFLGMSFMTHMVSLTCALGAAVGIIWSRRDGRALWAGLAGSAVGLLSMVRPLEAVAIGGLMGLWTIGVGGKRLKTSAILAFILGTLIVGGIGLGYNAALTADPLKFPINVYTDNVFGKNSNAYGFGADRGMGWEQDPYPGHGPIDALVNSNLNTSALNTELFGWSVGSFLLVAFGVCLGRLSRSDYLMLAVIAAIYVLHFFYYFSGGPDFGARYWFLMIVPLVVFTVKGINNLAELLDKQFESNGTKVYAAVMALCLMSIVTFIPWRAIDKYRNFRGMRPDIRYLAETYKFDRSLVLIRGNKHPDYDSAMIYNPLDFNANAAVYAWDRDPDTRKQLLNAFSDRPVWIIAAPSITQRGYEVVAGPLSSTQVFDRPTE